MRPKFCQWGVCGVRRWLRIGVEPIQIACLVSELRLFLFGSARFTPKSLNPTMGHRLPVTALALSARRRAG